MEGSGGPWFSGSLAGTLARGHNPKAPESHGWVVEGWVEEANEESG